MTGFSGLNTALSALYAQRKALEVAGQNIANANTEGYTRQRVNMAAIGAPVRAAIWSTYNGVGSGVNVTGIDRMRDAFVDARLQLAKGALEDSSTRRTGLSRIEQTFAEPGGNGLQSLLSEVWAGFDDVANNPGDLAGRAQVLQRVQTALDWMHDANAQFNAQFSAGRDQLTTVVNEVNTTASNIADLNKNIIQARLSNIPVNELEDQRDLLASRLSELTGSESRLDESGSLNVFIGGTALVNGTSTQAVKVAGPQFLGQWSTPGNTVAVTWVKDARPLERVAGQMNGLLGALNEDIPKFSGGLDAVVGRLVSSMNAVHSAGFGLTDGSSRNLLDPTKTTAGTVALAPEMLDANGLALPDRLAASSLAPTWDPGTGTWSATPLDGSRADAMAKLADDPTGPVDDYRSLVVELGVKGQSLDRKLATEKAVKADASAAWQSVSGVSLDDEMTSMLQYQRAYEAASRVMNAVDQMLDKLINNTGLVGR